MLLSTNFLKTINQFSDLNILFDEEYNGQILVITDLNFDNFESTYDLESTDKNISIVGDFNYKNNIINSKIILRRWSRKKLIQFEL